MKASHNTRKTEYSTEDGSAATKITFDVNPLLSFEGKVKEVVEMHKKHDEAFDADVDYYMNKVSFVQIVKLKKPVKTTVFGKIFFMVCDAHQCKPPTEIPFQIESK